MEENQHLTEIDDYLLGKMSATEKQEFEQRMEQDVPLKKDVTIQSELLEGMKAYRQKENFMATMSGIHEEYKQSLEPKVETAAKVIAIDKKRNWLRPILAIAASITLLIFALQYFSTPSDYTQLAQVNFSPYEDILTNQISASGAASDPNATFIPSLEDAIAAYNIKDFATAEQQFLAFKNSATTRNLLVLLADFYLAQIALKNSNYIEATKLLEPLSTIQGLPFSSEIHWYLGLAYLGEQKLEKAQDSFNKISSNETFGTPAKKLLEELR